MTFPVSKRQITTSTLLIEEPTLRFINRRTLIGAMAFTLLIAIGGYALWLNSVTHASWELQKLQREYAQRKRAVAKARVNKVATEIVHAENDFKTWQGNARTLAMQIAAKHPGTKAEAAGLLMVSSTWPGSAEGSAAFEKLPKAALAGDINEWGRAIERFRIPGHDIDRWRPLATALIRRADGEPAHPDAAWLLCKAIWLIRPDDYDKTVPEEFMKIADLIRDRYACSSGIANFCEAVGGMGGVPTWGIAFEPHMREIVRVNRDRYVLCSAKLALASIAQSAGIERQGEARRLLVSFLEEFNGEVDHSKLNLELNNRKWAKRMLETIQMHGLGAMAPLTVGLDIKGHPMALADYRGKVVLLSFWATWCAPCMAAIEHERALVEHFATDRFAIVGVNGDKDPSIAMRAVVEHGISWRSFQNQRKGGTPLESEWHVGGWPTFYLIDTKGVIVRRWVGLPPISDLESDIGKLVGE